MKVTQEVDHIPGKGVLAALACLVAVSAIGVVGAYFITEHRSRELARAQGPGLYVESGPRPAPGGPAPRPTPGQIPGQVPDEVNHIEQVLFEDRAPGLEERALEHALLRSYGWVDRDARLVRIPIDRAMELYVESYRQRDRQRDQQPARRPGQEKQP